MRKAYDEIRAEIDERSERERKRSVNRKRTILTVVPAAALLTAALVVVMVTNPVKKEENNYIAVGNDLMAGIKVKASDENVKLSKEFLDSASRFDAGLFYEAVKEKPGENVLISPLSVEIALAMVANGAENNTQKEMIQTLAGNLSADQLNTFLRRLSSIVMDQKEARVALANGIWFRDDPAFLVNERFLETNAAYYSAAARKAPFTDETVNEINAWVKDHTMEMIDRIVNQLSDADVMVLVNALSFEAKWQTEYLEHQVRKDKFTASDGTEQEIQAMHSLEEYVLLPENGIGFTKDYKNGEYYFAVLLPDESVEMNDFIGSLTGGKLMEVLRNRKEARVITSMPKFTAEYSNSLKDVLVSLGIRDAFDFRKADFSNLGKSDSGALAISDVIHKTTVAVTETGTKAAAATAAVVFGGGFIEPEYEIVCNRPFVYMIVEGSTDLPIFIGVENSVE